MLKSLRELYLLLHTAQRRRLMALQVLVILMSLLEVASVASIGPFMALVGNLDQIHGTGLLAQVYRWSGVDSPNQFVVLAGAASLSVLSLSAGVSMFTLWKLSIYGAFVGSDLGNRLFAFYMSQRWLFHTEHNSSQLTNRIAQEAQRVAINVINAFMQLNAKLVLAVVMIVAVLAYDPGIALVGVGVFSLAYVALYRVVRARLTRAGKTMTDLQALRYKLLAEGFGGIKDTILLGREKAFTRRFEEASHELAKVTGDTLVIAQVPRYAIELLAFGALIALAMSLTLSNGSNVGAILPVISVYALAGMKLLPAFQQVYSSVTQIRSTLPALDGIKDDLRSSFLLSAQIESRLVSDDTTQLAPERHIQLRDVSFRYPNAARNALHDLTLTIPANKVVGIVGASGAGKSTAVDVLLGLVDADKGGLFVDDVRIGADVRRGWQNSVGFVAQSIFLADCSIRENVAFGLPREAIDEQKLRAAVRLAHLEDLVAALPQGLDTRVGERGVQLSGGQRQRIGIARALYHNAQVLVLDEATSSLDGITEKLIMDAIHDFGGTKTIVMIAHRLATVRKCDWIYMLQDGHVIDQGTYDNLASRNAAFQRMAAHG